MTLIYIEQGDSEKATELMKVARAENPEDIYLMRADADMSYKMGRCGKVQYAYEQNCSNRS